MKTLKNVTTTFFWIFFAMNLVGQTQKIVFQPKSIMRLAPDHVAGDREFGGNGPDVEARVKIFIDENDRSKIVAHLYLKAKETRSNWTEAIGHWYRTIYRAPRGYEFSKILSDDFSQANYRDYDHDIDRPKITRGSLVKSFEIMGDTPGNDVGNNTSDDVFMNVHFNIVKVNIVKTGSPSSGIARINLSSSYGENGGKLFRHLPKGPSRKINKIVVQHGALVDAIRVQWLLDNGKYEWSSNAGGPHGQKSTILLKPNEYITKVTGRSGKYVDQITFYTSEGRKFGPYGGSGGNPFTIKPTKAVKGFYGMAEKYVNRIGVMY